MDSNVAPQFNSSLSPVLTMDSKDMKENNQRVSVEARNSPIASLDEHQEDVLDTEYLASRGLSKFYHSVLFQMILFGA